MKNQVNNCKYIKTISKPKLYIRLKIKKESIEDQVYTKTFS